MFSFAILVVILLALTSYYFLGRYNENYWKKRGVVFYTKNRMLGPIWDFLTTDQAIFTCFNNLYKTYRNEPAVGIGSLTTPALYIINIENVRHVLQTDFGSFNNRGLEFSADDLLADHVLFQSGDRWKLMRRAMTPLFTNNKLKNMYYIIDKSAKDFVQYLIYDPTKRTGDIIDTLDYFCAAALSGAIFGITTESIFESPFVKIAKAAFSPTKKRNILFALASLKHDALKKLRIKMFGEFEASFIPAIKEVIRKREKENAGNRHDFAELAVTLKKAGKILDPESSYVLQMTDEVLAAQAFFYYAAGVEPTATAIYVTLLELGHRPEVLEQIKKEIYKIWEKSNGNITFDNINEMDFLDKVFNEALRIHPPIGFLTRMATRDTILPVGNVKVEAGTKIYTPLFEIHHDPAHYPNPEEFDPERFSAENKYKYEKVYMPFGKGGRLCLGMRFARLQAKAGIVHLLRYFDVKTTVLPGGIKYSKQQVQVRPTNVRVELILREKE